MSFILTGVQHTKTGDVVIPSFEYETVDDYKAKYHHEMDYAMNNENFTGLGIKVFDKDGLFDVLCDNWTRIVPDPEPVPDENPENDEEA